MKLTKPVLLPSILSYTFAELKEILIEAGFEKYRTQQIYQSIYHKETSLFSETKNLPKKLIEYLNSHFIINPLTEIDCKVSQKKDTYKYLYLLQDELKIESVLIKEGYRNTLCISSQVGCPLDCKFCATGRMGMQRNLKPAEIVAQFTNAKLKHRSIDNIVFMGMGEPFMNYNNVTKAIRILSSEEGLNFSPRRITISTAGIVRGIRRLADENLNVHLAVSLNSPFHTDRVKIMPLTKKDTVKLLINACKYYQDKTKNRITFEYLMLKDINTRKKDAKEIIKFSKELNFIINLIQYNPIPNSVYQPPTIQEVYNFARNFKYTNVEVVQRKRKGRDISAACGQLATLTDQPIQITL